MDRVAAALQRDGAKAGDTIAICAFACNAYAVLFLGALRAGVAVAPLAPAARTAQIAGMLADSGAKQLFLDDADARRCSAALTGSGASASRSTARAATPGSPTGWPPPGTRPTAGGDRSPSGPSTSSIPRHHRHAQGHRAVARDALGARQRGAAYGYGPDTVTLLATPLYSNTTLVVLPADARAGRHGAC